MMNIGGLTYKNMRIQEEYAKNPKQCKICEEYIPYNKRRNNLCSRACGAKYSNKIRAPMTDEQKEKISLIMKEKYANGTLHIPNNFKEKKKLTCKNCGVSFLVLPSSTRKFCSKKCCCSGADWGGYRSNSGRGKQGWYKGFHCQSSWELAWVIYALDHNIKFERNAQGFEYEFEGKIHKYYPDFKLEDGSFVEVKGYNNSQWEEKKKQFKFKITIVGKEEIKPIMGYVKEKCGVNFMSLYEGNPHNKRKNKCGVCGNPSINLYCSRLCSGMALGQRKKLLAV